MELLTKKFKGKRIKVSFNLEVPKLKTPLQLSVCSVCKTNGLECLQFDIIMLAM
jgi:hypothetical protein